MSFTCPPLGLLLHYICYSMCVWVYVFGWMSTPFAKTIENNCNFASWLAGGGDIDDMRARERKRKQTALKINWNWYRRDRKLENVFYLLNNKQKHVFTLHCTAIVHPYLLIPTQYDMAYIAPFFCLYFIFHLFYFQFVFFLFFHFLFCSFSLIHVGYFFHLIFTKYKLWMFWIYYGARLKQSINCSSSGSSISTRLCASPFRFDRV